MMTANNKTMPVVFAGHGSPMNALADNAYTKALHELALKLPVPRAILCISAHWLTDGTMITTTGEQSELIYDFSGFPDELYRIKYPATGPKEIAVEIKNIIKSTSIKLENRGLDHGAWSVLLHMYPKADIPVFQFSIDIRQKPDYYLKLGAELAQLREQGILIIGSGNIVHNLRAFSWSDSEAPFGWAREFDLWVKHQLETRNFKALVSDYGQTEAGRMSVPSPDHYIPMLYILGASRPEDRLSFFFEEIQNGSIAMRSFIFENV